MPCKSEYLQPVKREEESALVCYLLRYVGKTYAFSVPEHVENAMSVYGNDATLDIDTALLCKWCGAIGDTIYGDRSELGLEVALWYTKHQNADAQRIASEKLAREREEERKRALYKLTPKERLILGL